MKRHSDTNLNEPEPKKANVGNRPLQDGEVREEFPIPDQLVGLVIGRGGENITRIQKLTQVRCCTIDCTIMCKSRF